MNVGLLALTALVPTPIICLVPENEGRKLIKLPQVASTSWQLSSQASRLSAIMSFFKLAGEEGTGLITAEDH